MVFINRQKRKIVKTIYNILFRNGYQGTVIRDIILKKDSLFIALTLPESKTSYHLQTLFPVIKQHMDCVDLRIVEEIANTIIVELAYKELKNITFNETMLNNHTLKLTIPTAFGSEHIDFYDSASCHMLQGGASRMGKTNFLLFLITSLYTQNKGYVKFFISSAKPKDFYPFNKARNIQIADSQESLLEMLDYIEEEYKKRVNLINSKELEKSIDAKTVIQLYPKYNHNFQPIFLVIDEYARYSDNKKIQKKVTEIVETMGYLNIHVILSSQRTDARTVLNPRIRANLMCTLAFTTKDKSNSELIIGVEGAERLGKIAGRGLLSDKDLIMVQIPYMDYDIINKMMLPFKEENNNESKQPKINRETTRHKNNELTSKMESLFTQSDSNIVIQSECESSVFHNQNNEAIKHEWTSKNNYEKKG